MIVSKDGKGENKMSWNTTSIIRNAQCIMNNLDDVRIQHVHKAGNQVVDSLVGYRHNIINDQVWHYNHDLP